MRVSITMTTATQGQGTQVSAGSFQLACLTFENNYIPATLYNFTMKPWQFQSQTEAYVHCIA